jgi:hypothetical protein
MKAATYVFDRIHFSIYYLYVIKCKLPSKYISSIALVDCVSQRPSEGWLSCVAYLCMSTSMRTMWRATLLSSSCMYVCMCVHACIYNIPPLNISAKPIFPQNTYLHLAENSSLVWLKVCPQAPDTTSRHCLYMWLTFNQYGSNHFRENVRVVLRHTRNSPLTVPSTSSYQT